MWFEKFYHLLIKLLMTMMYSTALYPGQSGWPENKLLTSGYATWFTAGDAVHIAHYDVIDDDITRKL